MRLNYKLGIVGAVGALVILFAAFGIGQAEVTGNSPTICNGGQEDNNFTTGTTNPAGCQNGTSSADIGFRPNGVWTTTEQGIDPAVGTTRAQEDCQKATNAKAVNTTNYPNPSVLGTRPVIILSTTGSGAPLPNSVILCVNADDGDGVVSFDANNASDVGATGTFTRPSCGLDTWLGSVDFDGDDRVAEWPDDACQNPSGVATGHLIVPEAGRDCKVQENNPRDPGSTDTCNNDTDVVMVLYTCPVVGSFLTVTIGQDQSQVQFDIQCRGQGSITLTARPATVEIIPAAGNTAHSLIEVLATDAAGNPILIVPGTEVDFTVNQGTLLGTGPLGTCAIEESGVDTSAELLQARLLVGNLSPANPATEVAWDLFANNTAALPDTAPTVDQTNVFDIDITGAGTVRSMAAGILHCDPHAGITPTPGFVTVQACIDIVGGADICKTIQVTVIGPPASITVAASPTSVRCGEKSTITVTVKDAVGQNVSDHTLVELVSNLGGTIGGTGAVAGFAGPVVPISSSVAGTFGGVATAFLLTSEVTTGPYEVVATTGGTAPGDFGGFFTTERGVVTAFDAANTTLGGIFSTPPISAQVTVTCSLPSPTVAAPAATVTAPRTGTGVLPPNTGDAGLKGSSSSWAVFAIAGMAAFALAGLATVKFARR